MERRGDIVWGNLLPWVIGILVLIVVFISYSLLSGKAEGAMEFLKRVIRFGR